MSADRAKGPPRLAVRRAEEADLDAIEQMVALDVRGHPAEHHPRPREALRRAYLGAQPVARLFVAERAGEILGMGQWTPIFDMFWSLFGGHAEWLFVHPEARGSGIAAAIIAHLCADVVQSGGAFLRAGADDQKLAGMYGRLATGWPAHQFYLSDEALKTFGALAGLPPRDIIRQLPKATA